MSELNEAVQITITGVSLVFCSLIALAIMINLLTFVARKFVQTEIITDKAIVITEPKIASTPIETIAIAALAAASDFDNSSAIPRTKYSNSNQWRDQGRRLQIQSDNRGLRSWR